MYCCGIHTNLRFIATCGSSQNRKKKLSVQCRSFSSAKRRHLFLSIELFPKELPRRELLLRSRHKTRIWICRPQLTQTAFWTARLLWRSTVSLRAHRFVNVCFLPVHDGTLDVPNPQQSLRARSDCNQNAQFVCGYACTIVHTLTYRLLSGINYFGSFCTFRLCCLSLLVWSSRCLTFS